MTEINVQPLRTKADIEEMKDALRRTCSERDRFLFTFGIFTGLRISDILPLRVGMVRDKKHVVIRERKTGKTKRFLLPLELREEIDAYTAHMADEDLLFPSRKGNKAISTTQAYRSLVKAGEWIGREDIGTHTMRKTFGYHFYKRTKDVAKLQKILNHSAPSVTLRYIGIEQDEIDSDLESFSF